MAVIRDGIEATRGSTTTAPEFVAIDAGAGRRRRPLHRRAVGAHVRDHDASSAPAGCSTPATTRPDRRGRSARAPSARRRCCPAPACSCRPAPPAGKDKGLFRPHRARVRRRRCAPAAWSARWSARTRRSRTPCTRSTSCCSPASTELDVAEAQRDALRGHGLRAVRAVRESYRADKRTRAVRRHGRRGGRAALDTGSPRCAATSTRWSRRCATYPVARTRPFFDAMEKAEPGTGGLFAATIDPWKCTGCLECVEVCGPGALTPLRAGRRRARRRCRSASSS